MEIFLEPSSQFAWRHRLTTGAAQIRAKVLTVKYVSVKTAAAYEAGAYIIGLWRISGNR
jgi:hypothetical protein